MKSIAVIVAAFALILAGCGDGKKEQDAKGPATPTLSDAEFAAAFHRGVMELEQHRFSEAAATFDTLAKARPALLAPWINLASAQLNRNVEDAHPLCIAAADRATAIDAKAPQPYFLRGILFKHLGRFDDAEKNFRKALEFAPDDPASLYHLASIVSERDLPEAIRHLEKAIEGETHLSSAYYALMQLKRRTDRADVGEFLGIFQAFEASNTGNKMNIVYTEMGRLGEAVRDLPMAAESRPAASDAPKIEFEPPIEIPGRVLTTVDLGGKTALVCADDDGTVALYGWSAKTLKPADAGVLPASEISSTWFAAAGDFDVDGIEDLAVGNGSAIELLKGDGTKFTLVNPYPLDGPHPAAGCLWCDLDQDGDLDLVAWNYAEVFMLINKRDGTFVRADAPVGDTRKGFQPPPLPKAPIRIIQLEASDLDADGDPDLVIAGADGVRLWRNDRLLRFRDVTDRSGITAARGAFRIADLDGNRALDILVTSESGLTAFMQLPARPFGMTFTKRGSAKWMIPVIADFDCDGRDEANVVGATFGIDDLLAGNAPTTRANVGGDSVLTWSRAADLNGDHVPDLIVGGIDATGDPRVPVSRLLITKKPPQNHALAIKLVGRMFANTMHSNMGGIGARVEVMAGGRSQVREMRSNEGNTLYFGLGTRTHADYVRIVWPDDVLQSEGWVPGNQLKVIEEFQRKASSCPILFAWNGERFECVTDFLGTGGLGFFIEPGVFAPPDPSEQVLIPNLKPKDGKLELRIHEPFEEITYLDVARLIVVDHPEGVDVVPDERLAINAPPPDGKLFAIGARIDPIAARDGRKNDILADIVKSDRRQAHAVADPRFIGYAEPTTFELDFGAALAKHGGSDRIVLALDGWVEYPYSHVNLAAFQAGVRLEAMSIDVETAGGAWTRIQNEACYPAGMPRLMTLPLGKLPDGITGKVRLSTNQELWIDRLFLFEPAEAALMTRTLDARRAELRQTGFPREYSPDGALPRLYDYDIRDPSFPWKTMGGAYTAFGEVGELLGAADDCYVVFGPGEEVAMSFDAPPPPAPGMKRTYILDSFGWCKDMDAHTAFPLTVDPLPFRGMSNYPYAASESFPDGEAQRRWRARYQTRHVPAMRVR